MPALWMKPALVLLMVMLGLGAELWTPPLAPGAPSSGGLSSTGLRLLEEMESAITDLAERVKPAVVSIAPLASPGRPGERFRTPRGTGSGVIIDREGHIVTNNHVVSDADEVEVRFSDKSTFTARVIGKDPDSDLALIKISTDQQLPTVTLGDSNAVKVGQWALAVGNPFGLDRTVTLGVVSGVGREDINLSRYESFIQTDSSIFPGNSGGPLFNLKGEVIGINTAIINSVQGIGFAIPSNMVKQVVYQLRTQGKVVRGWLGVGIQEVTAELGKKFGVKEGEGVLVNEVFENDPAAAGGIQPGDIITKVNGKSVDTPKNLSRLIAGLMPGAKANIEVVRDQERLELVVALTERKESPVVASLPSPQPSGNMGLHVEDLTEELTAKFKLAGKHGVLISKVDVGSLAQAEGLQAGDIITEVNRKDVHSAREFTAFLSDMRRGDTLLLRVLRESRAFYVVLKHSG